MKRDVELVKTALRIKTDAFDDEIKGLIDAAVCDITRVGVDPDMSNALVMRAITVYCKAHFGYDNPEAGRFEEAYNRIIVDLLNSSYNLAACECCEEEDEGE